MKKHWLITVLPLLGISFWFLLAFPFGNRNESYVWIAYFEHYSFIEIIQNPIPSIINYRPLAQVIGWCLYHLSGGNIILVQFINYSILCGAIWIMVSLTESGKQLLIRILYFLIGFIYISTFYYVFNLHGIFYSPILLLIALLLKAQDQIIVEWKKWLVVCLVMTLFHPFIVVLFVAYLTGWFVEKQRLSNGRIALFIAAWASLLIILKLLLPYSLLSTINTSNLVGITRNVEAHTVIKILSLALCVMTLLNKDKKQQVLMALSIVIYLPFAILNDLPFLLLLGALIAINLIQEKKMALLGLLAAATLFPLVVDSGAPTKASIFIFIMPYLLIQSLSFSFEIKSWIPKALSLTALCVIVLYVILVRTGVEIPIVSALFEPILAEKGKTVQLEKCLLLAKAQQPTRQILFLQQKQDNIRDNGQPMDRNYFPPAKQAELDVYQRGFNSVIDLSSEQQIWYLSFGEFTHTDTLKLIYTLDERNCQPAYIYSK